MRRRRIAKAAGGISLFPFLAVLICTMGALIAMLVMFIQQARVHANDLSQQRKESLDREAAETEELRLQQENYEWRVDVLRQQRTKAVEDLANQRLELSHLEDHIRRLTEKWNTLKHQADMLASAGQNTSSDSVARAAELERLQQQILDAQNRLELAKAEAAARKPSYSIIPYEGSQGTRRRPIYVECRGESITIQPEGIVLSADDFQGPIGPGNPLDAALRATREYWDAQGQTQWQGEPYPLLIVRPDGASSYAVARVAMKTWEDEFGYELVDADLQLSYPPADPQLANLIQRAVKDAREREAVLAAAMPSRYREPRRSGFRATARGGLEPVDGGATGGAGPGWHGTEGSETAAHGRPGTVTAHSHAAKSEATANEGQEQTFAGGDSGPGGPQAAPGFNAVQPLAGRRGADWALPKSTGGVTAITRPIGVLCLPDRLVLLPEKGDSRAQEQVVVAGPLGDSIDSFVSSIWKHMDGWGIAVAGGYWKPVLQVKVTPEAEQRFYELQRLLEGSGIAVERKAE